MGVANLRNFRSDVANKEPLEWVWFVKSLGELVWLITSSGSGFGFVKSPRNGCGL